KYFGQGILKSFDALGYAPSLEGLKKADIAKVSLWGILDLLGLLLRLKSGDNAEMITRGEMFGVEILQQLHDNPKLHKFLDYDETYIWTTEQKEEMKRELIASANISSRLREYLTE